MQLDPEYRAKRFSDMVARRERGETFTAIGAAWGISKQQVSHIFSKWRRVEAYKLHHGAAPMRHSWMIKALSSHDAA